MSSVWLMSTLFVAVFCTTTESRSLSENGSRTAPVRHERSYQRHDDLNCHGMSADVCQRVQSKMKQLQQLQLAPQPPSRDVISESDTDGTVDGCILLTEPQLDWLVAQKHSPNSTHRRFHKRQLSDFGSFPIKKWTMPIKYKFDTTQMSSQYMSTVRSAFQHWADNTCVQFQEVNASSNVTDNNNCLLVTSQNGGCYSYIGQTDIRPQQINLSEQCLSWFGLPLHEIGHSLGLCHEQMRSDRDDYIAINFDNILQKYKIQFDKIDTLDVVPYNYGSVMHYGPRDDSSLNGDDTMLATNSLYQGNMGQRVGLSYGDIKAINIAYCLTSCSSAPPVSCNRGGYQNPNNCSRCLCPDGFGGDFCEHIAQSTNGTSGGVVSLAPGIQQTITSPGYFDNSKSYAPYTTSNWLIKAPESHVVQFSFTDQFGIHCESRSCFDWVEVKYKRDLGLEGPRFCCADRPTARLVSESSEMVVVFKSNSPIDILFMKRGFQARIQAVQVESTTQTAGSTPKSIPAFTTPGRTSTITSTAASSATTTGKPAQSPTGSKLWSCSFEPSESTLCGTTQDQADNFDWTVFNGSTPSDPTGPDYAFDGLYYVYIEASNPRQPNDEARLLFPMIGFSGRVCVDFHYHMFGFHVKSLALVQKSSTTLTTIWMRSGNMGNTWYQATVDVDLSTDSQLLFVGIRGEEYSGDIGLDAVSVVTGGCRRS